MVDHRQVLNNALLTVVQVIVNAAALFFVYRYLLFEFGAKKMGIWSIVAVIATLARVGDFGFTGGMTKFVAKYRAVGNENAVHEVVETGVVSLAVLFALFAILIWEIVPHVLPMLLHGDSLDEALMLFPSSIIAFVISAVAAAFLSALDGMLRTDRRNLIQIFAAIVYCGTTVFFTRREGLIGIAHAQVAQAIVLLVGGCVTTKLFGGIRNIVPWRWSSARFREMARYNANLQVGVITSFLLDPLSKILLGKFSGMETVGYFEMATKLVSQFRGIVVNVNQVLVPVIAQLHERDRGQVNRLYQRTYVVLFFVALVFYSCVGVAVPIISLLWLGQKNNFFIYTAVWVLGIMFVNTLIGPAYFSNQGTGRVWLNTKSQFMMGVTNLTLGILGGCAFGGMGVIAAYGIAISLGSVYLLIRFTADLGLSRATLFPLELRGFALSCGAIILGSMIIFRESMSLNIFFYSKTIGLCLFVAFLASRCDTFGSILGLIKQR